MELKKIKLLTEQKQYEEAIAACEQLLQNRPEQKADILRARASVFARSGSYERALQDRQELFQMDEGKIADYYLAADNALSMREFGQACSLLDNVLRLGEEQDETWFKSGTYFLLAYAKMELGEYEMALTYLEHAVSAEADVAMPIPGMRGVCSHQQLREEIISRKT